MRGLPRQAETRQTVEPFQPSHARPQPPLAATTRTQRSTSPEYVAQSPVKKKSTRLASNACPCATRRRCATLMGSYAASTRPDWSTWSRANVCFCSQKQPALSFANSTRETRLPHAGLPFPRHGPHAAKIFHFFVTGICRTGVGFGKERDLTKEMQRHTKDNINPASLSDKSWKQTDFCDFFLLA